MSDNIEKKLINEMIKKYPNIKEEDILFSFCPYRVCPFGAHIDHQKGKVTGFAIDYGITIAYVPSNNHFFEATSLNFDGTKGDSILDIADKKNDWADYIRGSAKKLHEKYGIDKGMYAIIDGSLPIGGVSSSAAVIISFMNALCKVNGISLSKEEMITLSRQVENEYVGVSSGTLDQSCELLSSKDHLLYLDTSDGSYRLIPKSNKMLPFKIAIIFSGVKRTLVGSSYNTRVDELKCASYALKSYANMPLGSYKDSVLRDVPRDVFEMYKDRLPENFRKRAEHYYTEMERVERGVEAWVKGDIEEFGRISFESGESSIYNYEAGSPELKAIHEIMQKTKGVYGGRFSGAGFKGSYLGIINPLYEEEIKKEVTEKYLRLFPEYRNSFNVYYCNTSDGCILDDKHLVKRR